MPTMITTCSWQNCPPHRFVDDDATDNDDAHPSSFSLSHAALPFLTCAGMCDWCSSLPVVTRSTPPPPKFKDRALGPRRRQRNERRIFVRSGGPRRNLRFRRLARRRGRHLLPGQARQQRGPDVDQPVRRSRRHPQRHPSHYTQRVSGGWKLRLCALATITRPCLGLGAPKACSRLLCCCCVVVVVFWFFCLTRLWFSRGFRRSGRSLARGLSKNTVTGAYSQFLIT